MGIPGGVALLQVTMKRSRTCGSITSAYDFQCYSSRERSNSIRVLFFFFIDQLVNDTYDYCLYYIG